MEVVAYIFVAVNFTSGGLGVTLSGALDTMHRCQRGTLQLDPARA